MGVPVNICKKASARTSHELKFWLKAVHLAPSLDTTTICTSDPRAANDGKFGPNDVNLATSYFNIYSAVIAQANTTERDSDNNAAVQRCTACE